MRLFGFDLSIRRSDARLTEREWAARREADLQEKALMTVSDNRSGWAGYVREAEAGNWQRNIIVQPDAVRAFHADFSCRTRIASDVAKLDLGLQVGDENDIWTYTNNPAYSPVLRKPNGIQTRLQFYENWMLSKLSTGNTFVLKERDGRGVVIALYILDPWAVRILVAEDGSVFYQLNRDNMAGINAPVVIPAREIIHDRFNGNHPLLGIPPLYANGLAATQGLEIQKENIQLFDNRAMPSGLLVAPTNIEQADADRLQKQWQDMYGGKNRGKVGVVGNGVKYEKLTYNMLETQALEQLKYSAEIVCATYHVPAWIVGYAPLPTQAQNVESSLMLYYSACLQVHLSAIELCLKEGLALPESMRVAFVMDDLLKMDTASLYKTISDGVRGGFLTPNEGRWKIDKKPIKGGDTVYLQEQDHSLQALAERDAGPDPFKMGGSSASGAPALPAPAKAAENDNDAWERERDRALLALMKGLR